MESYNSLTEGNMIQIMEENTTNEFNLAKNELLIRRFDQL